MACLLQAACEDKGPDTRPIQWERWKERLKRCLEKILAENLAVVYWLFKRQFQLSEY